MKFLIALTVLTIFSMTCGVTEARLFGKKRRSQNNYVYVAPKPLTEAEKKEAAKKAIEKAAELAKSDQERCEMEAKYMADNEVMGHFFETIGHFEGCGVGSSPNPGTCVPWNYGSNARTLTGDATCKGKNGFFYRCRSWR